LPIQPEKYDWWSVVTWVAAAAPEA
jgi:hypothetical protein